MSDGTAERGLEEPVGDDPVHMGIVRRRRSGRGGKSAARAATAHLLALTSLEPHEEAVAEQ